MKKGMFSMMNYYLPLDGIASMHCSANTDMDGKNTAIFFGLSGTGKTTLSTDPKRLLIGDDEHGWDDNGVFNFEGGCYAKVIDLDAESEPDIYNAIRRDAPVSYTHLISKLPPAKRPINTVFQKYALFPYLNIYDNIAFGLKMKKVPKEVIREKVKKVLEVVDLEGFEKRKISTLSGGQQQRVAIARAIVNEPEILLSVSYTHLNMKS